MQTQSAFEASLGFQLRFPQFGDFNIAANIGFQGASANPPPDIESRGDEKPAVVVLLGWFGADYKYLGKYSDIYLQKGCIVLECITPVKILMHDKNKLPLVSRRVISMLEAHNLVSNPLFFHSFSNAGAWVYSCIVKELAKLSRTKELDVRGTIFDSAPFPLSTHSVYNTMVAHYSSSYLFGIKYPLAAAIGFFWSLGTFLRYNQLAGEVCIKGDQFEPPAAVDAQTDTFPHYNWLQRICGVRNHAFLFLYSKADAITPCKQVEKIGSTLQHRGNSVMLVKFPDSKHVEHFRTYPEEYTDAISTFLENQMEASKRPVVYWD